MLHKKEKRRIHFMDKTRLPKSTNNRRKEAHQGEGKREKFTGSSSCDD